MERVRVDITDPERPDRQGALTIEDDGRVYFRANPALATALLAAKEDDSAGLGPLHLDDRRRGLALLSALAKGLRAALLRCEFASGTLELRAYVDKDWARLTIAPADFDPDAGWEFLVAMNEASLEAAVP